MKHLSYFVAMAALLMFASCQKEDTPTESSVKDPVFTATIANDETKTSLDLSTKKVSWTMYDEITVTDNETPLNTVKYEVSAIDGTTGAATFTKKSGESGVLGSGPYIATYGEALSTSQTYTATDGVQNVTKLPMTGASDASDNTKLTFTVSCGLLKVTLTEAGQSIKSVAASDGTTTYTLTCSSAVSIASGATFCIAVPAATYTSFAFTNSSDIVSTRKNLSIVVAANHIKPVSSSFSPKYTEGEYTGYGIYVAGKWWAPVNCGYDATHTYGSLYQWGRRYGQAYELGNLTPVTLTKEQGEDPAYSGNFGLCNEGEGEGEEEGEGEGEEEEEGEGEGNRNWFSGDVDNTLWNGSSKGTYDPCPAGWRVPTYDELNALYGNNTKGWTTGVSGQDGFYFNGTNYCTSETEGNKVFLPFAGYRSDDSGDIYSRGTYVYYWSSSVEDDEAWYLFINKNSASMSYYYRAGGFSVRCVQE